MTKFRITSKEKFGDMPRGTTLIVDTPLSSCDPDKIKAAIKAAGYNRHRMHIHKLGGRLKNYDLNAIPN